jgi:hypothetical protein
MAVGGRAERIVFSVSNDRILFAGGRHVCMCISIVLMGIPPVSYIVYMQNRNNCVCVTLLSKRKERRTNTHTKSEKRKIETTHNAESSPRRVYGRLLFARVRQQSQGPHVVNIYVHV